VFDVPVEVSHVKRSRHTALARSQGPRERLAAFGENQTLRLGV
jgi:hypothetical protein